MCWMTNPCNWRFGCADADLAGYREPYAERLIEAVFSESYFPELFMRIVFILRGIVIDRFCFDLRTVREIERPGELIAAH